SNLYECKSTNPLRLEEAHRSECVQVGGVFVDRAARELLKKKLENSRFGTDEFLDLMIDYFEVKESWLIVTFLLFTDMDTRPSAFSGARYRPMSSSLGGIAITTARTTSSKARSLCRRKKSELLEIIARSQSPGEFHWVYYKLRTHSCQHMLLVGGFGESPHLQQRLREQFEPKGSEIVTVDQPSGGDRLKMLDPWIEKDKSLVHNWELVKFYSISWKRPPTMTGPLSWEISLMANTNISGHPLPKMRRICTVTADLPQLAPALEMKMGATGQFWIVNFEIVIRQGMSATVLLASYLERHSSSQRTRVLWASSSRKGLVDLHS
ncbi:15110_t:CDS:2, partial [Acaulospora colombiana]